MFSEMEKLVQIKMVANNLKTSSTKAVKALHKFIFEQEGDRGNRKRQREFKGFPFAIDSDEYKSKISYVEANLGWGDLVSVCNILAIDYAGTKRELSQRICNVLVDLDSLNDVDEADRQEDVEVSDTQEKVLDKEEDEKDTRRKR